ncbi:MAG: hypothetical protein Q7T01_04205 [bacterium]|nr:hypothetical protein [bacterium]
MTKDQFVAQIRRVLMIPGVCPKEQRAQVIAQLEALDEAQFAQLMAVMQRLPKEELLAALRSGDTSAVESLLRKHS